MTSYTPGPWEINGIAIESGFEVIAYLREPTHFQGDIRPGHKDEAANANLIAAAPELYEALEDLLESPYADPHGEKERMAARAALAKARGEQP